MIDRHKQNDIVLEAHEITVRFGDVTVLDRVSFKIHKGEFIGLIGPNGAGKSTLLKAMLGLLPIQKGSCVFGEGLVVRYVPQQYVLPAYVPISVAEVIRMGAKKRMPHEDIAHTLKHVGLDENMMRRNFHALSGGQKQRVIIARALIANPDIILFDEPLSGVDALTRNQIYELLEDLNEKHDMTIFFVSHDIDHVVKACDRVLCLDHTLRTGCHPTEFAQGMHTGHHEESDVETHHATCAIPDRPIHHHH